MWAWASTRSGPRCSARSPTRPIATRCGRSLRPARPAAPPGASSASSRAARCRSAAQVFHELRTRQDDRSLPALFIRKTEPAAWPSWQRATGRPPAPNRISAPGEISKRDGVGTPHAALGMGATVSKTSRPENPQISGHRRDVSTRVAPLPEAAGTMRSSGAPLSSMFTAGSTIGSLRPSCQAVLVPPVPTRPERALASQGTRWPSRSPTLTRPVELLADAILVELAHRGWC